MTGNSEITALNKINGRNFLQFLVEPSQKCFLLRDILRLNLKKIPRFRKNSSELLNNYLSQLNVVVREAGVRLHFNIGNGSKVIKITISFIKRTKCTAAARLYTTKYQ